jgi:Fe-S-cluster containining protein
MLLPEEASAIAAHLNMPLAGFLSGFCSLYLQLFPSDGNSRAMQVNSTMLPAKVFRGLERLAVVPQHLIALPSVALKRKGKRCIFYDAGKGKCDVNEVKPHPCRLFPLISSEQGSASKSLSEAYPFCRGLQASPDEQRNLFADNYPKTRDYFTEIERSGFTALWKHLPESGVVSYRDKEICRITKDDFLALTACLSRLSP